MFSRRLVERLARGRLSTAPVVSSRPTPGELIAALQILNTWHVLSIADLGVAQATAPGRASSWADQSGNGRTWTTATTTAEPTFVSEPTLGGRYSVSADGTLTKYMVSGWDPPAPGTTPFYRVTVLRQNQWLAGRTYTHGSTINRIALTGTSVPDRFQAYNGTALGGNVDMGSRKWILVEEYFSNSTNDFVRLANRNADVTGINVGNFNSSAPGLFATPAGATFGDFSIAFQAYGALPSDRAAVRAALLNYYPSITVSGRPVRYLPLGDSQTRHDIGFGYAGYRKRIHDVFDATYQMRSIGASANGAWALQEGRHGGVSGQDIANCSAYVDVQLGSGGATAGAGVIDLVLLNIGAADVVNAASAGTMLTQLESLATNVLTRETSAALAVTNLVPLQGDPTNLTDYNAGIPSVITSLQAAFPGRVEDMIDINSPMGGTFDPAKFIDDRHMNENSSYHICGAPICAALATRIATISAS
jgi:hypothetical protein